MEKIWKTVCSGWPFELKLQFVFLLERFFFFISVSYPRNLFCSYTRAILPCKKNSKRYIWTPRYIILKVDLGIIPKRHNIVIMDTIIYSMVFNLSGEYCVFRTPVSSFSIPFLAKIFFFFLLLCIGFYYYYYFINAGTVNTVFPH